MSTKPGVTICPSASMSRCAAPTSGPISAITPSRIAMSTRCGALPVPSTTEPFLMTRSCLSINEVSCSNEICGESRVSSSGVQYAAYVPRSEPIRIARNAADSLTIRPSTNPKRPEFEVSTTSFHSSPSVVARQRTTNGNMKQPPNRWRLTRSRRRPSGSSRCIGIPVTSR